MVMRYSEMVTGDKFQISEFVCCDFALLVNMVQRSLIKFPRGHVWYWNYIWLQNLIHPYIQDLMGKLGWVTMARL